MTGCQGNRGEATRLGSKDSGVGCWVKSWRTRCSLEMRKNEEGKDLIGVGVSYIGSGDNLSMLDLDCRGFEDNLIINGIEFKKLLEAYEIVNFPKKLEIENDK